MKWISKAITTPYGKRPGTLREALCVKPGMPIPTPTLAKAAKAAGRLGQQARLAQTLRKYKKK